MAGRQSRPEALKEWFREIDADRNGMLSEQELARFLKKGDPKMTDKDVSVLFAALDRDHSGEVLFDELVDFIFQPPSPSLERALRRSKDTLLTKEEVEYLQAKEFQKQYLPLLRKIELFGAMLGKKVDGVYSLPEQDWIVCSSAGASEYGDVHHNGRPLYECQEPRCVVFFGWLESPCREGWFIAKTKPADGAPVTDFLLFNHSPNAETPDLCCAPWELRNGSLDRRLCCEGIQPGHLQGRRFDDSWKNFELVDECLDEELWPFLDEIEIPTDEDEEDDDSRDWQPQPGEEWPLDDGDPDEDDISESEEEPEDESSPIDAPGLNSNKEAVARHSSAQGARCGNSSSRARSTGNKRGGATNGRARARKADQAVLFDAKANTTHAPGFAVQAVQSSVRNTGKMARTGSSEAPNLSEGRRVRFQGGGWRSNGQADGQAQRSRSSEWRDKKDGYFIDKDFPPIAGSVGETTVQTDGWQRASLLHNRACLFYSVEPDDSVGDTTAGNLWFASACAAVAEYPAWIHSMFGHTFELSPKSKYVVRLFHPGRRAFVRVTIDDFVPTMGRSPAFAGISVDGEIWVALVEKAFAKLCGSYANLEWGDPAFGMHYICGGHGVVSWERVSREGPSWWRRTKFSWTGGGQDATGKAGELSDRMSAESKMMDGRAFDPDELWAKLRRYMERCFPVTAGADPENAKEYGLLTDRLYSILGAREVPVDDLALRMVLLRNPFGVGEWKGRWSDGSDAWEENPGVAEILEAEGNQKPDGTFWMSYTDFLEHFKVLSVCRKSLPIQGSMHWKHVGLKRGLGLVET